MNSVWFNSIFASFLVSLISLVGITVLLLRQNFLTKILLILVSFSAGALLGDVFFHIFPEIYGGFEASSIGIAIVSGILGFFVLEKILHWRHCHIPASKNHHHPLATINLVSDGVHNFIDGLIISAGFLVSFPVGLATVIAVIFHEIPQEIGDFSVLIYAGIKPKIALFYNFLSAILAIVGALVGLILQEKFFSLTNPLLAFAAGGFLYLACSDLIPELKKETSLKKSSLQLLFIIIGILLMYSLKFIEN
ncbi:MAG: zinc/iron permease [Candidatus Berkelbacteria bacterium Licking1014_85]|uniref:Zinc/iron permease n=1 Tax=Candidatus Berkelbacteria bacterium Licking1014_85 TaxID=2017148 RepID=A0A554LMT5_9BACT|nr:MAG: zinc/iron permease [Candidatus Berkelbacteria bacterium Licking1014_85]